jgi:hypothetical protein
LLLATLADIAPASHQTVRSQLDALALLGLPDKANAHWLDAAARPQRLQTTVQARAWFTLAETEIAAGNPQETREAANMALEIFTKLGM